MNIPIKYPDRPYRQEEYAKHYELVHELNQMDNGYKWELDNSKNDEYFSVNLTGMYPISATPKGYDKKYHFFVDYKHLQYIDFYTHKDVAEKFTQPQFVGVLHKNKVKAWVDYLIQIYEELVKLSAERTQAIEEFKKAVLKNGGNWSNGYGVKASGYIERNGIEYRYEISDSGYISQKIEVPYSTNRTLEAFLKLSDNKYTSK